MYIHKLIAVVLIVSAFLAARSPGFAQDPPAWARVSDAQQAAAKKLSIPVAFENPFGMRFVLIPAGTYMRGTSTTPEDFVKNCEFVPYPNEKWIKDEAPQHEVTISKPFYMAMCELSQGQAAKIAGKSKAKLPEGFAGKSMPVCVMDQPGAMTFCETLRDKEKNLKPDGATIPWYTLPTEAQWEYACRAGTTTEFSFGNVSSTDRANYHGFAQNYTTNAVTDPVGPLEWANGARSYCIRGGSWRDFAHAARSTFRMPDNSWWNRRDWYNSGLRIVVPLDAEGRFAAPKPKEKKKK